MRVAVACAFHESNTFAARPTARGDFGSWRTGDAVLELTDTQTATGGFLDGCAVAGWTAAGALHAWATPSGPLTAAAFAELERELEQSLRACGPVDGLLLELHGAMVAEGVDQADRLLAVAARRAVGDVPIVAVLDPHANFAPKLADAVDVAIAYQSNPHVDMNEAGRRAVGLLGDLLGGEPRPATVTASVPVLAAPIGQATAEEPLAGLLARARAAESEPGILAATLFFGFAYADVPDLGMHVAIACHDSERGSHVAADLAAACWDARERFARALPTPAGAIETAASAGRLAVVADTGDNVGGGAAGDRTELLAAALADGRPRFATTVRDPAAVATARAAGVGARLRLTVGTPPLELDAEVVHLGPGRYRNRGPLSAGAEFDQGEIAVVRAGRGQILLQTRAVMANDMNMLAAFGIDIDRLDAVMLKGAAAVRAGWTSRSPLYVDAGTPGATPSDLAALKYHRAPRPSYPLDPAMGRPLLRTRRAGDGS